jgi:hypothetical protein
MVAGAVNGQSFFASAIRMANDPTGREPAKGDAPLIYLHHAVAHSPLFSPTMWPSFMRF